MFACLAWTSLSALLAIGVSTGTSHAEDIYRWRDREGRVHFGSSPPPDARSIEKVDPSADDSAVRIVPGAEGRADADKSGSPMSTSPKSPSPESSSSKSAVPAKARTPAARAASRLEASEPKVIGGRRESQWRSRAFELEGRIETLRERLGQAQDRLSSAYTLGNAAYYQRRVQALEQQIEDAEAALEAFEDEALELGVPPGWLR